MKPTLLILTLGTVVAFSSVFAADKEKSDQATAKETAFIKKAASRGMTEVELGKIAEQKGQKEEVKDFGKMMIKDHGIANDDLKDVASKMKVSVPDKVDAKHQAKIDKLSKMSGAGFDTAYVKEMVAAHEKDIAAFEKARGEVNNEDLKKFIDQTVPVMKGHLEMVKKMQEAK
jgi:putative membrane protein